MPGNGCPDGIHYDVKGNLWVAAGRLGGIIEIDPRGIILGFVQIPNGDLATTNFAFGGPDGRSVLAARAGLHAPQPTSADESQIG
jgi:sugar lactone lactonase YvrE